MSGPRPSLTGQGREAASEAEQLEPPGRGPAGGDKHTGPSAGVLSLKGSFGTAVGAAMLGLEQALRDGPPAQIQASEQVPDPRGVDTEGGLRIAFPVAPEEAEDRAG